MNIVKPGEPDMPLDPRVASAWRAASVEEPPAALDAAILAAARREVGAGPQTIGARDTALRRRQWWPLAAAATLAALTVGLLQLAAPDRLQTTDATAPAVSDVPAGVRERRSDGVSAAPTEDGAARSNVTERAAPPAAARIAPPPRPAPAVGSSAQRKEERAPQAPAPPEPFPAAPTQEVSGGSLAPSPAPRTAAAPEAQRQAPVAAMSPERAAAARDALPSAAREPAPAPPPAAAPAASPPSAAATRDAPQSGAAARPAPLAKLAMGNMAAERADEARAKAAAPLPVPDWIALIRRLRGEGRIDDAARELAAFRKAHADHDRLLPPDLRDWQPPEK